MQFNSDSYIKIPPQCFTPVFEKLIMNKIRKRIILSTGPLRCNTLEFGQEGTAQGHYPETFGKTIVTIDRAVKTWQRSN